MRLKHGFVRVIRVLITVCPLLQSLHLNLNITLNNNPSLQTNPSCHIFATVIFGLSPMVLGYTMVYNFAPSRLETKKVMSKIVTEQNKKKHHYRYGQYNTRDTEEAQKRDAEHS